MKPRATRFSSTNCERAVVGAPYPARNQTSLQNYLHHLLPKPNTNYEQLNQLENFCFLGRRVITDSMQNLSSESKSAEILSYVLPHLAPLVGSTFILTIYCNLRCKIDCAITPPPPSPMVSIHSKMCIGKKDREMTLPAL